MDSSGAGLAFTINSATYTQIGRVITVRMDITFPVTANGSPVLISGLPFGGAPINSSFIIHTGISAFEQIVGVCSSTFIVINTFVQNAVAVTNANLSTGRLTAMFTYATA